MASAPLRVGIDLTCLLPNATGIDHYLSRLLRHVARIDRDTRYTLFLNREDRGLFPELPPNFEQRTWSARPRACRLAFQQLLLPAAARMLDLDVVHSPSFLMPIVRGRARHLLTVYDLTSFSSPQHHTALRRSAAYRWGMTTSIRRAHMLVVPSRHVRSDLLARMPHVQRDRVQVITPGIGEEFTARADAREAAPAGLPQRYILFVGTLEPRKNLLRLLDAYARLVREGIRESLVLAGQLGWQAGPLLRRLARSDIRDRVLRLGYVRQSALPGLYRAARLFVYPSLSEGFGFPPLEAMACGTPTIAADGSSLAENLDGAALLVPPEDESRLAEAMRSALHDEPLRARLREQGHARAVRFRWDTAARQQIACYEALGRRRN